MVGANPGPQFKEIYDQAKEEELAQQRMAMSDCTNAGEEESEEDELTISQSRKVVTEETVEYRVSQSRKIPGYNEEKMQVRSGKQICCFFCDITIIFQGKFCQATFIHTANEMLLRWTTFPAVHPWAFIISAWELSVWSALGYA